MSTSADPTPGRSARSGPLLRVLAAITLGYSGYLHLRIALERPPLVDAGQVTLSGLFVAQAVAAAVVVLWVLARADLLAWLAYAAVAGGSLLALLLSVWVRIPSIGPLPVVYEPVWYTDKYLAAISAGLAVVVALVALGLLRRPPR